MHATRPPPDSAHSSPCFELTNGGYVPEPRTSYADNRPCSSKFRAGRVGVLHGALCTPLRMDPHVAAVLGSLCASDAVSAR